MLHIYYSFPHQFVLLHILVKYEYTYYEIRSADLFDIGLYILLHNQNGFFTLFIGDVCMRILEVYNWELRSTSFVRHIPLPQRLVVCC